MITTRRPMPPEEGVERLARIAHRRLDRGQDHPTVLAWLRSASTREAFGSTAVGVVHVLLTGRTR